MKNTQKHTQGPWHATNYHVQSLVHEYDGYICKAEGNTKAEAEANARLIAAAPDLLTALNEVLGDLCDFQEAYPDLSDQFDGTFAKINAALAKTEGNA